MEPRPSDHDHAAPVKPGERGLSDRNEEPQIAEAGMGLTPQPNQTATGTRECEEASEQ
jgi:hypothetical protein